MSYLDTSLLVAYYCPESLSTVAENLIRKVATPTIGPLVEVELHSAVALKHRMGELNLNAANRIVAEFRLHLADGLYRALPLEAREFELARTWLAQFTTPLRTLDALHLACAFANGLSLLTADKGLATAAKQLGVSHRLIV